MANEKIYSVEADTPRDVTNINKLSAASNGEVSHYAVTNRISRIREEKR